jgi:hypothetical protein
MREDKCKLGKNKGKKGMIGVKKMTYLKRGGNIIFGKRQRKKSIFRLKYRPLIGIIIDVFGYGSYLTS